MDNLKAIYGEQCRELNMDHDTEEKAWERFTEVSQRFKLEDPRSWIACALYASSRESWTPTVGSSDAVVMGNCVSLTKLLRCCNISIYEFIRKIKKWHEMANLPDEFRKQIELLERNFSITFLLYQQYKNIFKELFSYSNNDKKNPKFRSVSRCSFGKLYDLCWYLFLCVKNESSDTLDLVTSFHILICCIDLIYRNVLGENRIDLVNQNFAGFPQKLLSSANANSVNMEQIDEAKIFENLCALTDVKPEEAEAIKNTKWKNIIEGFFDSNTLCGDRATYLDIISNQNFDRNLKSLKCSYEQYILSVGTFDERLLLNNQSNYQANSPASVDNRQHVITMSPDCSITPRRAAAAAAAANFIDIEASTEKVRKLLEVTHNHQPSEYLRIAGDAVFNRINEKLSNMTNRLFSFLPNTTDYENRLRMISSLYYILLEKVIRIEVNNKPHIDVKILLDTESFHTTLIICCAEIVLNSYNSENNKFPWILHCFSVDAFNFYRIIELVVGRHDATLTRLHIRHLNAIEESCLESLAWKSTSTLWDNIQQNSQPLPAWIDVDANTKRTGSIQQITNSPINSAFDTFNAVPNTSNTTADSARKDLFNTTTTTTTTTKEIPNDSSKRTSSNSNSSSSKNERMRSLLNIFFRKFYKLAWLRIKELCKELNMENESCLKTIWTLFEYSIIHCTDLMRDRHLDQIIMCAIYIYIRVTEYQNNKFIDIMKAYRKQPQSLSSTYREVLIEPVSVNGNQNDQKPIYQDLIYFYNKIYVEKMQPYALGFSKNKSKETNLMLSPHPTERQNAPKKISSNHKIFVSPMEKFDKRHSPDSLIFGIGRSPAKDLQRMNDVVKRGKRNLPFNEDQTNSPNCKEARLAPAYLSTIQGIINDRQTELS